MQSVAQCVFAVFIWYTIIQRQGRSETYLIGWGIIVPLSLYLPFLLIETFQVQSRIASAGISTVTIGPFFRVIEAMYGTSPAYVTKSLSNYVGYMSSVVPYVWDPKTESRAKILPTRLTEKFLRVMGGFILLSTTLSFLKQYDYKPFPTTVEIDQTELTWELLSFNHIINAYLCAWLVFGTLMAGFEGTSIGENAKGFDTHHLFHSPFFQSRSPTEFWTK